jgi:hypothetical protein
VSTTAAELEAIDPVFWEALCLMQLLLFLGFELSQIEFACRASTAAAGDTMFPERPKRADDACVHVTLRVSHHRFAGATQVWTGCVGVAPYSDADRELYWKRAFDAFWGAPEDVMRPLWEKSRAQSLSPIIQSKLHGRGIVCPRIDAPSLIVH